MGPPVGPAVKRPREDSNLGTRLRRAVLYPLSYGGFDVRQASMNPKFRGNSAISQDTVELRMLIPVGHHQFRVFRAGLQELADHQLPRRVLLGVRSRGPPRSGRWPGCARGMVPSMVRRPALPGLRFGWTAPGSERRARPGRCPRKVRWDAARGSQETIGGCETLVVGGVTRFHHDVPGQLPGKHAFLVDPASDREGASLPGRDLVIRDAGPDSRAQRVHDRFRPVPGLRHQCGHSQLLGEQQRTLVRDASGGRAVRVRPVLRGATGGEGVSAGA